MTALIIAAVIGVIVVVSLAVLMWAVWDGVPGFETMEGFHYGEE